MLTLGYSQGYWPDGLYTPPTYEAMVYDLQVLKNVSMNMVRKHIKIEPDLWYQACDKMGLLVIQDMPSLQTEVAEDKPNKKRTFSAFLLIHEAGGLTCPVQNKQSGSASFN